MTKRTLPRVTSLLLALLLGLSLAVPAAAAQPILTVSPAPNAALLTYRAEGKPEHTAEVKTQSIDGQLYLFLPSSADLTALALTFAGDICSVSANGNTVTAASGEAFDFKSLFPEEPEDGIYAATFSMGGTDHAVGVMVSGGLRSLYLTSSDPEKGQAYVNASKSNKAKKNELVLLAADGSCIYEGVIKEIKGRGNSTWTYPKKPYQIKLNDKADLLGSGEASKTWILLANYADDTLFRNRMTNDLARTLGLKYAHNSQGVDLYYDGIYCGSYLLSEKTEIGSGRIDIRDLEGEIEAANGEDVDFDDLDTALVTNRSGNPMQVVEGVKLPADYTGGYLLELDYESRAAEEKSWFSTTHGQYVVCKSPEYLPAEAMHYVSDLFQAFEDAVYNGGRHPTTGRDYTQYVDLESLAKSYLLLTLAQNGDAFLSSTYFYIPQGSQKLYSGPVWDFDTAYGLYAGSSTSGFIPARTRFIQKLLQIDSFRREVERQWNTCLKQAVSGVLLGDSTQTAHGLKGIPLYAAELLPSHRMDAVRWGHTEAYADSVEALRLFLEQSCEWVDTVLTDPNTTWSTSGFFDVPAGIWYEDAVSHVAQKGYFSGVSDVIFLPDGSITRAMMVTVLYRMAGQPDVSAAATYSDVPATAWYSSAVAWAEEVGLTTGYRDGTFRPTVSLSRAQLAVFLYRFAQLSGKEVSSAPIPAEFEDGASVPAWAEEAFGWAIRADVLTGSDSLTPSLLAPSRIASRAETAAMIRQYDTAEQP